MIDGRISSGLLTFTSPDGTVYDATTLGLLHGGAAESVSGLFYTNDLDADYLGGFVGSM